MGKKNDNNTFIRITNKDLWDDIRTIHKKVDEIRDLAKETNGKVKFHQKLLFGIGPVILAIIGWLIMISLNIKT